MSSDDTQRHHPIDTWFYKYTFAQIQIIEEEKKKLIACRRIDIN